MLRVQTIQIGSSAGSSWWCVRHSVCSRLHYVHLKILFEHLVKVVLLSCLTLFVVNNALQFTHLAVVDSEGMCRHLENFDFFHLLSVYYLFPFILPLTWIILVCSPCPISVPPWATNTVLERELSNSHQGKKTTYSCLSLSQKQKTTNPSV